MTTKIPIPVTALDQHTIALGKTRSGKSSKLRLLTEHLLSKDLPVGIIDPKGDWWGIRSSADSKKSGFPVVIFGGEHADVPINERSGVEVAELVAAENRPYLIDLGGWTVGARTRFFIDFTKTLFRLTRGKRWLVIDECHNFAPQGRTFDVEQAKALHWANRLASEGQGKGLVLLSASQRPQKVNKDYVTSHETLIACRVIHPLDRGAIKDWVDGCADPAVGKAMMTDLAQMPRTDAYVWSPEIGFGPERIHFPMFATYDSFKPQEEGAAQKPKGWAGVDLAAVTAKLAKVVEEAKANDPAALHATIARLTAELGKKPAPVQIAQGLSMDEQAALLARGREEGFLVGHHVGAGLGGVVGRYIANAIKGMETQLLGQLSDGVKLADAQEFTQEQAGFAGNGGEALLRKLRKGKPASPLAAAPAPLKRDEVSVPAAAAAAYKAVAPVKHVGDLIRPPTGLDGPLQRILDSIRYWNVFGLAEPTHQQVAFIANYVAGSGTWSRHLSSLRSAELIEAKGALRLTDAGAAAAHAPGGTPTGGQLRAMVMGKIDAPLVRILDPLLESYPAGMSHEELAGRASYVHGSGTWSRYLSSLRSLDLIEKRGELKAQAWLFPDR